MALPKFLLCLSFFASLVAASSCKLQVMGTGGIGIYQDDLSPSRQVVVWKSFYAQEKGTTFFSVVPSDIYISILVGDDSTYVEGGFVLAAPGTAWKGQVNQGQITGFVSAGSCSSPSCVVATVDTTTGFGRDPVWVRVYKGDVMMTNYSLAAGPGTATFQIDQNSLYVLWDQREDQVRVTDEMRTRAVRVNLTECNADPTAAPVIVKLLPSSTPPYYTVEQPRLDPLGSSCGPANSPDCVSVTFHGHYYSMQVAAFVQDQQWLDTKNETFRPTVWQKLPCTKEGAVYSFPYDERLFVGALVFTTRSVDELNYIITGLHPAQPGQVFDATLDDGGIPQLTLSSDTSDPKTITFRTPINWLPKYANTSLVVMKNGVPLAVSGPLLPNETFAFQPTQANLFFKGDNQFYLYQKIEDFDIEKATGFNVMQKGRKFLGVETLPTNVMAEISAAQRCALTNCSGQGTCNKDTGLCECNKGWRGVECSYTVNSCDGIDCGVHGYCSLDSGTWKCNCVDQWSGVLCQLGPGLAPSPKAGKFGRREKLAVN